MLYSLCYRYDDQDFAIIHSQLDIIVIFLSQS